jgi:hypothetical protein
LYKDLLKYRVGNKLLNKVLNSFLPFWLHPKINSIVPKVVSARTPAFLPEMSFTSFGTPHFSDHIARVHWATFQQKGYTLIIFRKALKHKIVRNHLGNDHATEERIFSP